MSGALRFGRRLVVVCLAVAVVVGLGYAWKASPAAGLVADGGDDRRPPGVAVVSPVPGSATDADAPDGGSLDGRSFDVRRFDRRSRDGDGVSLSRIDDLVQTLVTLGFFVVVVVLVDRRRRRRRPIRPVAS